MEKKRTAPGVSANDGTVNRSHDASIMGKSNVD